MRKRIPVILVDSHVPVPPHRVGMTNYPLSTMEIGDSFQVPVTMRNNVQSRVSHYKKQKKGQGKQFIVKKVDDKTLRVWRTQ